MVLDQMTAGHADCRCAFCATRAEFPIPYTITDLGRAYLAALRAMELLGLEVAGAHPSSGTRRRRQALSRKR